MYFGNVDGQVSPELTDALKRYQMRKGFEVTGMADDETAVCEDTSADDPTAFENGEVFPDGSIAVAV